MTKKNNNSIHSAISLITATFIYGSFPIFSRAIGFDLPLYFQSVIRGLLGTIILFCLTVLTKSSLTVHRKDLFWFFLRSLFGGFAFFTSYIAFNHEPIGTVYFIYYCGTALGGYFWGSIFFREKITPIKLISLILALSGLFFIYSNNFSSNSVFYLGLSFISGLGTSIWSVFSKKISYTYSAIYSNCIDTGIYTVLVLFASILLKEQWIVPSFSPTWIANYVFGLTFVVTGSLVVKGFKYLNAQIASLFMLLEVVFGILFGFILYHEELSLSIFIGGIIIISAISLQPLISLITKEKMPPRV